MNIPNRNSTKLKIAVVCVLAVVLGGWIYAIYETGSIREGTGVACLFLGTDLIMPNPSLDWLYFVFPVALIFVTISKMNWKAAVLLAYALSHLFGLIFLLFAILLLGKDKVIDNVKKAFDMLVNDPMFIYYVLIITLIIIVLIIFDLKFLKKRGK
jgi:hypothetical protein